MGIDSFASRIARDSTMIFGEVLEFLISDNCPKDLARFAHQLQLKPNVRREATNDPQRQRSSLAEAAVGLLNSENRLRPTERLKLKDQGWATKDLVPSGESIRGVRELDAFFSRSVSYLGPLRTAPASSVGYSMRGSGRGVGPDGAQLAYLLVTNPAVAAFKWTARGLRLEVESYPARLVEALSYWVRELGLAASVRAEEVPGVGDAIKLEVQGVASSLSPGEVGVGVSQALPVVAAVLLSNPGELIILEQPELHLHPDAQLGLAAFFVAAMKSGRRLLIESHSEHFLNTLRLMTAQASDDEAGDLCQNIGFLFAERNEQGSTSFREVGLTRDGSIQDWPKGFFDQGAKAARELFMLNRSKSAK